MVTAPLAIASELIHLSGISWQTYESLLNELAEQSVFSRGAYCGNG
jgi:hypothetical protein